MIRNASFLNQLPEENVDDFVDPNPIAAHKLDHLKQMLKSKLVCIKVFFLRGGVGWGGGVTTIS